MAPATRIVITAERATLVKRKPCRTRATIPAISASLRPTPTISCSTSTMIFSSSLTLKTTTKVVMSILVLLCQVELPQQPQLERALLAQEPVQELPPVLVLALAQVQLLEREPAQELPLALVLARAQALSHQSQVSEPHLIPVRLFLVYHKDPRCSSLATVWACRVSLATVWACRVSLRSLAPLRWAQQESWTCQP